MVISCHGGTSRVRLLVLAAAAAACESEKSTARVDCSLRFIIPVEMRVYHPPEGVCWLSSEVCQVEREFERPATLFGLSVRLFELKLSLNRGVSIHVRN